MPDPNHDETATVAPLASRAGGTLSFEVGHGGNTPHLRRDDTVPDSPLIPGYDLLEEIGDGGMGVVYKAYEPAFHRQVALKVMKAAFDGVQMRRRFEAEATLLRQLDHPNVVRVYAAGEVGACVYYAMKLVDGGPLSDRLREYRRDATSAVRLLAKIARAVQYLHDRGVWHRDLKPQNILIDDGGEPLVADFGVAKWVEGETHSLGFTRVGTYAYMAPEMIELGSAKCGPQADIWSLGVMLHELLAGARPFPGENRDPTLPARVVNDPPSPLTGSPQLAPGTDDRLEAITLRALAKDPGQRYPTAAALADDLDRWRGDEPGAVSARSLAELRRHAARGTDTTKSAAARPSRRWRGVGWLAAGLLLAGVAVAVAALTQPPVATVVAERGECVIVDENGTPLRKLKKIPGSRGELEHDAKNGWLVAPGTPLALYEIADPAPPPPFRLRAKVYHSWGAAGLPRSFVGLYARRGGHPSLHGEFDEHDTTTVGMDTVTGGGDIGTASQAAAWLDLNQEDEIRFLLVRSRLLPSSHERPVPRHPVGRKDFRELVLDVYPDRVVGWVDGVPFPLTKNATSEFALGSIRLTEQKAVPHPLLGGGYGLIVTRGEALFKDIVVSRLP